MALLFFDGYDHVAPSGTYWAWQYKYGTTTTGQISTGGRAGTKALYLAASDPPRYVQSKTFAAVGGFVVGFAVKGGEGGYIGHSATDAILGIREGTIEHLVLATERDAANAWTNRLIVRRGGSSKIPLAVGTTVLLPSVFYHFEIKGVIHDSAGSFSVRINGELEPGLTRSGLDTRNGGTGQWDGITLWQSAYYDDLYILDTSGPDMNDFLGMVKVETLLPVLDAAGVGTYRTWIPSTGTDHGAMVNESDVNESNWNRSPATPGAKETYQLPNLTMVGAPLGVQVNLFHKRTDPLMDAVSLLRAGSVEREGLVRARIREGANSYGFMYTTDLLVVNPATGLAWTAAEVNALEAGMKTVAATGAAVGASTLSAGGVVSAPSISQT